MKHFSATKWLALSFELAGIGFVIMSIINMFKSNLGPAIGYLMICVIAFCLAKILAWPG